jgi:TatD DNase family protein
MILERKSCDEQTLINEMTEAKVNFAIQVSTSADNLTWSKEFALKYADKGIYYTIGIHPSYESSEDELMKLELFLAEIVSKSENEKTPIKTPLFGIGECGIDYHYKDVSETIQINSFDFQIALAKKYDLPLIVHSREAWEDTCERIKKFQHFKGIMHCFSGGADQVKEALNMGYYISFAGNLTYKKAEIIQEAAKFAPLENILLETDAPFLSPVPFRGKINSPNFILNTYEFIAQLKGIDVDIVKESVLNNFNKLRRNKYNE